MNKNIKQGYISTLLAFFFWGIAPLYFKALGATPALEILAHRVAWSFPTVILIMLLIKRPFPKNILADKKTLGILVFTGLLISSNWLLFTWAVVNDRVLETSLGYFINPLLSVALGVFILKEKLGLWSKIALGLALLGVLYRVYTLGSIPWVSISLATTFAFYGLLRKQVNIGPLQGLLIETLIFLPLTAGYLMYLYANGQGAFILEGASLSWLLVAGGIVTTVPLALFAAGARILPLNSVGIMQYLAPSLTFILAIFVFNEPFNNELLVSFALIWLGLLVYSIGLFRAKKA